MEKKAQSDYEWIDKKPHQIITEWTKSTMSLISHRSGCSKVTLNTYIYSRVLAFKHQRQRLLTLLMLVGTKAVIQHFLDKSFRKL